MKLLIRPFGQLVLLGGGPLLLSLADWCKTENIPVLVVTSPRHSTEYVIGQSTLGEELINRSILHFVTDDIGSNNTKNFLGDLSDSFCLSLGAAWVLKQEHIDAIFKGQLFNLHGTRLPQNRGGGGFSWQIMMGNRLGYCQLHLIDSGIDSGDLVRTKEFLYPAACRIPADFESFYNQINFEFIIDFIREIKECGLSVETTKQSEYFSSYWPRLSTEDNGWIDWRESTLSLERFICAFDNPYEGCKTFLGSRKVFIKSVMSDFGDQSFHSFQAGIIYRKSFDWLMVATYGGSLIIQQVLNEEGINILREINPGDRFVTPSHYLEARYERVTFKPQGKIK